MLVYLMCYGAAFFLADSQHYVLSGVSLMAAALYLYLRDYGKSGNYIHLRGLFSLAWVGGQGISCLKLSRLQTEWEFMTWLCFFAAYAGFYVVFEIMEKQREPIYKIRRRKVGFRDYEKRILVAMAAITLISVVCFALEAAILGFIPFFVKDTPHAYSTFHISGVHYFTIACVLVPALSVIFFYSNGGKDRKKWGLAILLDLVSLGIPILCVSRFQLILAVFLAVLVFLCMDDRMNIWYAVGAFVALIPVYLILTVARSHDITYLNGIFEMKDAATPIFVTQPYMYIANNFDNFNCMVRDLPSHTYGLRMLFPVWALTGLKFIFPSLVSFPIFFTKKELTTVTLFYDAYYDFGIIGVLALSCLLGFLAYHVMRMAKRLRNPVGYLLYAQVAMYLMLAFFTTWLSNPTTWFWLALTGFTAFYVDRR